MDSVADQLYHYLYHVIYDPEKAVLDVSGLPEDFRSLGEGLRYFCEGVMQANAFAEALSKGELDYEPPSGDNRVTDSLKSLQTVLRHLTWQVQQVAKGDFQQKIEFMGDFSDAFNSMVDNLKEQRDSMQRKIDYDALTQVYNREFGMEILLQWLSEQCGFILCFIDLDGLKQVNDEFGHNEGDNYIVRVAELLTEFLPEAVVSRLGGDEFMVLAKGWKKKKALRKLEQLQEKLIQEGTDISPYYRISYGVVEADGDKAVTAKELLYRADEKMYEDKKKNKQLRRLQSGRAGDSI